MRAYSSSDFMPEETTLHDVVSTLNDVLHAVNEGFTSNEKRFEQIDRHFEQVDQKLTQMVTMDFFEDKIADLRGDLVVLMRKEDKKLTTLIIAELFKKKLLENSVVKKIMSMEPFPQL